MVERLLAIEAVGLTKLYGTLLAVNALDFSVDVGEVFGFLGPNGAGKTTTIRMLTTLSGPSYGNAWVFGHDVIEEATLVKRAIGVVPEVSNLYDDLSVWENLLFAGHLYGVPESEVRKRGTELLARFDLEAKRDDAFATLSKGMKRRATIAAALIPRPELLFLDEPTSGLDVFSARELRSLVQELNAQGMTVFLTSHNIEEAAALCHRVAFIVKGKIVALDTPQALRDMHTADLILELGFDPCPTNLVRALEEFSAESVQRVGDRIRLFPNDLAATLRVVGELAEKFGSQVTYCATVEPSLEDVFVKLTGVKRETMRQETDRGGKDNDY